MDTNLAKPVRHGDQIDLDITSLAFGGDSVGRHRDFAVFVPGGLPGERVRVRIAQVKDHYAVGEVLEVLKHSPDRVAPTCSIFQECGGCQWQHFQYPRQLQTKRQFVLDALKRIGKIENAPVQPCLPSPDPYHYRNKAMPVLSMRDGRFISGIYEPRSHHLVPYSTCPIQDDGINELIRKVLEKIDRSGLTPYQEKKHSGFLRHLTLRRSGKTGETLLAFVTRTENPEERVQKPTLLPEPLEDILPRLARELMEENPGLVGVLQNVNPSRTNVVFGPTTRVLAGRDHYFEVIDDLRLKVSLRSFLQVNTPQADILHAVVREALGGPSRKKKWGTILDLYSGIGTLAMAVAPQADYVVGVEEVGAAVEDARENARINQRDNIDFLEGDVSTILLGLREKGLTQVDAVILDPPRKGVLPEVLSRVTALHPERLVYVSCDPSTLARDLALLVKHGYSVDWAQPLDMFPQTYHVETVVKLTRETPLPEPSAEPVLDKAQPFRLPRAAEPQNLNLTTSYRAFQEKTLGLFEALGQQMGAAFGLVLSFFLFLFRGLVAGASALGRGFRGAFQVGLRTSRRSGEALGDLGRGTAGHLGRLARTGADGGQKTFRWVEERLDDAKGRVSDAFQSPPSRIPVAPPMEEPVPLEILEEREAERFESVPGMERAPEKPEGSFPRAPVEASEGRGAALAPEGEAEGDEIPPERSLEDALPALSESVTPQAGTGTMPDAVQEQEIARLIAAPRIEESLPPVAPPPAEVPQAVAVPDIPPIPAVPSSPTLRPRRELSPLLFKGFRWALVAALAAGGGWLAVGNFSPDNKRSALTIPLETQLIPEVIAVMPSRNFLRYEWVPVEVRLNPKEKSSFPEMSASVQVFRNGEPVTIVTGNSLLSLKKDESNDRFWGNWPIPFNPSPGTYVAEVTVHNPHWKAPKVFQSAFTLSPLRPSGMPQGYAALTMEGGKQLIGGAVPALDGSDAFRAANAIEWARFLGANAYCFLMGQTSLWDHFNPKDFPFSRSDIEIGKKYAKLCHQAGLKFAGYMTTFKVVGDAWNQAPYQFSLSYDQDNDEMAPARFISLADEKRRQDIVRFLQELDQDPNIDMIGMDYVRMGNGGYEWVDEFLNDLNVPAPKDIMTLPREERILWLARTVELKKNKEVTKLFQWWKAHKVAVTLRDILQQAKVSKPVFTFTLAWEMGHQHGQDPAMYVDAGINYNHIMLYEGDRGTMKSMETQWPPYLARGNGLYAMGEMVDFNWVQKSLDPPGPEELYDREVNTFQQWFAVNSGLGMFWHDLYRIVYGVRGPYSAMEWTVSGGKAFTTLQRTEGLIPIEMTLVAPKKVPGGVNVPLSVEIRNRSPEAIKGVVLHQIDTSKDYYTDLATVGPFDLPSGNMVRVKNLFAKLPTVDEPERDNRYMAAVLLEKPGQAMRVFDFAYMKKVSGAQVVPLTDQADQEAPR